MYKDIDICMCVFACVRVCRRVNPIPFVDLDLSIYLYQCKESPSPTGHFRSTHEKNPYTNRQTYAYSMESPGPTSHARSI